MTVALGSERRYVAGYRLEAMLGRGRNSVVYLALSPSGNRKVALKVVARAAHDGLDGPTNLQAEFAAQAALAHAQVIEVFEHGFTADAQFMAMEYAVGGTLARRRGPIGSVTTLSLLTQAASGLAWLHQHGWVHRDVKPANLLVRADGTLALGDFGCVALQGDFGTLPEGSLVGTPQYAAPEQTEGSPAQPAADVYSLGACLYRMLCGRPPYPGETMLELQSQHLLAPVPRLPAEHAAWQPLLDAMLAKNPDRRLADGCAVLARLQPIGQFLQQGPANQTRGTS